MTILINGGLYQAGWFCCVLGAAHGYSLQGAVSALVLTAIHVLLAVDRGAELKLILSACGIGVVVDSAQQSVGVVTFRSDPQWPFWLPLWILVVWAQFGTLFHYALGWLHDRYLLASALGLVGGPLAYGAGVRLGAATFGSDPLLSFAILAFCWSLVTPLLVYLAGRLAPSSLPARYRILQSVRKSKPTPD